MHPVRQPLPEPAAATRCAPDAVHSAATGYSAAPDRTFEFGLDAILDGFEAQLTKAT
ncbi:TetR/AcrR family transcriptional regulator C-terminal domain-containing protein [Streptomyces tanashiensis]|uniref:TetR/AcrR family transcriptional regulator C-terminal domain-containing protein n=1 Tax=Streptomyces tanashiensis TaxID=67367 RepID=A0ABY6QSS7_9ACTN|nr:TetR/AcrR family transcriptional regulator C-terminal domain-containing protein [Streptomyces tanashiensis]UZX20269.1 TetR/AcrR family transcriptional regulator C-terminal domain-containing protein [Streptomyces tanashiensis]